MVEFSELDPTLQKQLAAPRSEEEEQTMKSFINRLTTESGGSPADVGEGIQELFNTGANVLSDLFGGTSGQPAPGGESPTEGGSFDFSEPQVIPEGGTQQSGLFGGSGLNLILLLGVGFLLFQQFG